MIMNNKDELQCGFVCIRLLMQNAKNQQQTAVKGNIFVITL
jgi:hypothetical protein